MKLFHDIKILFDKHNALYYMYLFKALCHALYLIGYIVMVSRKGTGNQYIELVKGLYCKLPIIKDSGLYFEHLNSR